MDAHEAQKEGPLCPDCGFKHTDTAHAPSASRFPVRDEPDEHEKAETGASRAGVDGGGANG